MKPSFSRNISRNTQQLRALQGHWQFTSGGQAGSVSYGILEWIGDEVRVLMAGPGRPRPEDFSVRQGTLSQWRRSTISDPGRHKG